MDDCEFYGSKHRLKFKGAINVAMLTGGLVFDCRKCSTRGEKVSRGILTVSASA